MNAHINFGSLFAGENLRPDGSNFIEWYQRLRNVLHQNNVLYTIEEPIGEEPGDDMDEVDDDAFRARRDYYILVQVAIINTMIPQMKSWFFNTDSNVIIDDLKTLFAPQVLLMKHECLDEFLSCKMEEHTCLETHLAKMHQIHRRLTHDLDYWMTDDLANSVVLRSLPPSYKNFVNEFVMGGESVTFQQFMARVRTVKVEPIEGEIVDPKGICDIQSYKCFSINTYCSF